MRMSERDLMLLRAVAVLAPEPRELPEAVREAFVARWNIDVLNLCLSAGVDTDALTVAAVTGVLPDPTLSGFLSTLRDTPTTTPATGSMASTSPARSS